MRTSSPCRIVLAADEERTLRARAASGCTKQRDAVHARIVLAAASGAANAAIAAGLRIPVDTVRKRHKRFFEHRLPGLKDLSRPGRPPRFTPVQAAEVRALACTLPAETGVPLTRWSGAELVCEAVARGVAASISRCLLARPGHPGPPSFASGAGGPRLKALHQIPAPRRVPARARPAAPADGRSGMRIVVDLTKCQGYGQCAFLAPQVFTMQGDEELVYDPDPAESQRRRVLRAAASCPVQAIRLDGTEAPPSGSPVPGRGDGEFHRTGRILIVGASLAGLRAAEQLRADGFAGRLTLVGDELHEPYDRVPLSKQMQSGWVQPDRTVLPRQAGLGAEWRLGAGTTGLDVPGRQVQLADGARLGFDKLLIATGLRTRPWPHPAEAALAGVVTLRTRQDAAHLRRLLAAVAEPHRFLPDRPDNQHLGFGAPLARLETQVALTEFARRVASPRLAEDPPQYRPSPILRGPLHLPVDVEG